jgi:hypothetical protein
MTMQQQQQQDCQRPVGVSATTDNGHAECSMIPQIKQVLLCNSWQLYVEM